jgi:replicative DNA helicase Mcm
MSTHTNSGLQDALKEYLYTPRYLDVIDSLTPTSIFRFNASETGIVDLFNDNSSIFLQELKNAIIRIKQQSFPGIDIAFEFSKLTVELTVDENVLLHDLSPKYENSPIQFVCEVIGMDERKSHIIETYVVCPKCFTEEKMVADFYKKVPKGYCGNPSCKRQLMEPDMSRTKTEYVQTVLIQEPLEQAVHNSPVIFTAKIYGSHIGKVFVGQKKRVTGIFKSIVNTKDDENDIVIQLISMEDLDLCDTLLPSDSEIEDYKKQLSDPKKFISKLVDSFAPEIYADDLYKDIKLSILLQLVGGVKTRKRGDINQLLVGDPSMAKSELLKASRRLTQKSIFTSGRGASAAGLTIGIVELPNGRKVAQAGVMALCSGGHAMIDEFDKMNPSDRSAMHEAMEQQTVSIAKAGINLTLPAQTSVMAAANPIYGKYDLERNLAENLNLPPPLLTRFDFIWLLVDVVNTQDDTSKAQHILSSYDMEYENVGMAEDKLMAYLNYARQLKPTLSKSTHMKLISVYNNMRSKSTSESITVGVRQLEAMVRFSMARAKLLLKSEVDEEDVLEVTKLLKSSYRSLRIDLDKGEGTTQHMITENSSKDYVAKQTWDNVAGIEKKLKYRDYINALSEHPKFDAVSAEKMWNSMVKECQIKQNGDGSWEKTV